MYQTPAQIFAAIAQQLALQCLSLPTALEALHDTIEFQPRSLNAHEAVQLILEISKPFKKIFVVLDALDEWDNTVKWPGRKAPISGILNLSSNGFPIMVTNRPNLDDIVQAFSTACSVIIVANPDDVESYLRARLDESDAFREIVGTDETFKSHVVSAIAKKCDGRFLLPALHIEMLSELTCRDKLTGPSRL